MKKCLLENSENLKDLEPDLKWSIIKIRAKELTEQFGKYNKILKKQNIDTLREKLDSLEKQLCSDKENLELMQKIIEVKNELEIYNIARAEAARIRSKVEWIEKGEKCTNYF